MPNIRNALGRFIPGKVERKCLCCGKHFSLSLSSIKVGKGKYCSKKCYGKARRGVSRSPEIGRKISVAISGDKNYAWKGGIKKTVQGYKKKKALTHPYCDGNGYVMEHRLIMEKHLGRILLLTEVVHHINNDPADNRIENLMLFANDGEHTAYHWKDDYKNRKRQVQLGIKRRDENRRKAK